MGRILQRKIFGIGMDLRLNEKRELSMQDGRRLCLCNQTNKPMLNTFEVGSIGLTASLRLSLSRFIKRLTSQIIQPNNDNIHAIEYDY